MSALKLIENNLNALIDKNKLNYSFRIEDKLFSFKNPERTYLIYFWPKKPEYQSYTGGLIGQYVEFEHVGALLCYIRAVSMWAESKEWL